MKTNKEIEQEYIDSYDRERPNAFCIIIAFLAVGGLFGMIYGFAWLMMNLLPKIIK